MSPVVQIIAADVEYSFNNGITMLEFDDGEFYDVPDFAAKSMIARGWAKLVTADDLAQLAAPGGQPGQGDDTQPKPPPVQDPHHQPPPKPKEGDDDDDDKKKHPDEKRPGERQALQTKGKR